MNVAATVEAARPRDTERVELSMHLHSIPPERFWSKVDKSGACWLWTASLDGHGYGHIACGGAPHLVAAHRWAYQGARGPIPHGSEIDHLCREPRCVNPAHLEAVTHSENIRRGFAWHHFAARNRAKTHCPKGHPYSEGNTYRYKSMRFCRECHRLSHPRRTEGVNRTMIIGKQWSGGTTIEGAFVDQNEFDRTLLLGGEVMPTVEERLAALEATVEQLKTGMGWINAARAAHEADTKPHLDSATYQRLDDLLKSRGR